MVRDVFRRRFGGVDRSGWFCRFLRILRRHGRLGEQTDGTQRWTAKRAAAEGDVLCGVLTTWCCCAWRLNEHCAAPVFAVFLSFFLTACCLI